MIAAEGHGHALSNAQLSIPNHGAFAYGPYGQNAGIGGIDDGGKGFDPKHSQITDRESVTFPILGLEFLFFGLAGVFFGLGCDLNQVFLVGKTKNGNNQAFGQGHGNADVYMVILTDAIPQPRGVDRGMLAQGHGCGFNDQIVDRNFDRRVLVQSLPGFHRLVHVNFHGQVKMRGCVFGFGESARDGLAHLAEGLVGERLALTGRSVEPSAQIGGCHRFGGCGGLRRGLTLEVPTHNAAVVSAALNTAQVQALFGG